MIKNQAGVIEKVVKKKNCIGINFTSNYVIVGKKGEMNRVNEVLFYFRRSGYSGLGRVFYLLKSRDNEEGWIARGTIKT